EGTMFLRTSRFSCDATAMRGVAAKRSITSQPDDAASAATGPLVERRELRVLIVEDRPDDEELILLALRRGGYDVVHERVESAAAMSAALARESWDVVLSDYSMPRFSGPAALELLRT